MQLDYIPPFIKDYIKKCQEQYETYGSEHVIPTTLNAFGSVELKNSRRFVFNFAENNKDPGCVLNLYQETDFVRQRPSDMPLGGKIPKVDFMVEVHTGFELYPRIFIIVGQIGDIIRYVEDTDLLQEWAAIVSKRHYLTVQNKLMDYNMRDRKRNMASGYMSSIFSRFRDNLNLDESK